MSYRQEIRNAARDFAAYQVLEAVRHELAKRTAPSQIRVNWKAYYENFVQEHGLPMKHEGCLLFADVWRYGLAPDYSGPEMPPPTDPVERQELELAYWVLRERWARDEAEHARKGLAHYAALQQGRTAPVPVDGDLEALRKRAERFEVEVRECGEIIEAIKSV